MKRFYVTGPHAPHGAVGRWAVRDRTTGHAIDIARRKEDATAAAREHNAEEKA